MTLFRSIYCCAAIIAAASVVACTASRMSDTRPRYDLILRNGTVYDGTGNAPIRADVLVSSGRIVAIGSFPRAVATHDIDVQGQAVAPGFINMLSWAVESVIEDGRALSDVTQGVTLEIFGEGLSMGPLTEDMKRDIKNKQSDISFDIPWTSLGEYLAFLERKGVSVNVASFIGAGTVRMHVLGEANRPPTAEELQRMRDLVGHAMEEGALGVGSALIYSPASYARTDELKALALTAAAYGGGYISHMRSEGDAFLEALNELLEIGRATGAHVEAYHLKAAGKHNWPKMAKAIQRIEQARAAGMSVSANMYTYTAGSTGLDACMDPAVREGGTDAWISRLKEPATRKEIAHAMFRPAKGWENICYATGSPDNVLLVKFKNERLKALTGKSLAEIARSQGRSPAETLIDLVIEDHGHTEAVYFLMSEENVRLGLSQSWVSIGSDGDAPAPEGVFLKSNPHPRSYGTFARFLGKYVREDKVATLSEGIRRITALPASNWGLRDRGRLAPGFAADIVVFDPAAIVDNATFEKPHQLSTGVNHVWVNGVQVLKDGLHTNAKPGRVVRGPGYIGRQ